MRVLIIAPYYEPDLAPGAPIFTMLSEQLVKREHKVTVLAGVPHYPSGRVSVGYRGRRTWQSRENGVEVIRVPLPSLNRKNLAKRLLQFIFYQIGATWAGFGQGNYDAALVCNPGLQVWLPFALLVALRKIPAVFSVQDLYPDGGIRLGIFRHRPVIAAVAGLERFCLSRSSAVWIISQSFRPAMRSLGVPEAKMTLLYDWVDTDLIHPLPHDNPFAREHGLADRFIVLYAGNMGLSQGLENILAAAETLIDKQDLLFVFVGDGAGRERLMAETRRRRLDNVQFIPFQSRKRLSEVLASAHISLVTLQRGMGSNALPSKTLSIMASGRPVLVSMDEGSETWHLVKRADAGICVPPDNPSEVANAILNLKGDKALRERLGHNGRLWAERNHSPQYAAERMEKLLLSAIAAKGT